MLSTSGCAGRRSGNYVIWHSIASFICFWMWCIVAWQTVNVQHDLGTTSALQELFTVGQLCQNKKCEVTQFGPPLSSGEDKMWAKMCVRDSVYVAKVFQPLSWRVAPLLWEQAGGSLAEHLCVQFEARTPCTPFRNLGLSNYEKLRYLTKQSLLLEKGMWPKY